MFLSVRLTDKGPKPLAPDCPKNRQIVTYTRLHPVTPVKTGVQIIEFNLDFRLRGNDDGVQSDR
jgi:hypothetical protein